jgi:dihydroorotate dehydrogenase electron transfer subunit
MTASLHAAYYADRAEQVRSPIVLNEQMARDTFKLRVDCPQIAARITPGQFVMLRLAGWNDPLIGRPFALYDCIADEQGQPRYLDVVYLRHGKLTSRLASMSAGQLIDLWGPLGNGFAPQACEHLIMVAGGIGQTPFLALAKEHLGQQTYGEPAREVASVPKVSLCYGARSADYLAGIEDFEQAGIELHISTDDGSRGHHGLVTDTLREVIAQQADRAACRIVCCGPEPMMQAVAKVAAESNVACQVSLETPMACGIGICFTCVAKVIGPDGQWDYKRTCVEGPVFEAEQIVW